MRKALWMGASIALVSACAARKVPTTWQSPLLRDHPLVGRVWDVRQQRFADLEALKARARDARFVLIGEIHDNPDHHRVQAELLRGVASSGRRPAVAFEMLDVSQQPAVDRALAEHPGDPDAIARAVDWEKSGWPEFAAYRPIFEVAEREHLPIVAANLSRTDARRAMKEGASALEPDVRQRLERDEPFPEAFTGAMRDEMRESHCGQLPESMVDPMVLAQRARDAQLALRMEKADLGDGVVLIAGGGHARNDRGVPRVLGKDVPDRETLSVGLLEVSAGEESPKAYAAPFGTQELPFDFVVFTPAFEREDPCKAAP